MEAQAEAANRQTGASSTLRSTGSSALIRGVLAGIVHVYYSYYYVVQLVECADFNSA
jgi:hypothetical protein